VLSRKKSNCFDDKVEVQLGKPGVAARDRWILARQRIQLCSSSEYQPLVEPVIVGRLCTTLPASLPNCICGTVNWC
jgi:hypothetical protein